MAKQVLVRLSDEQESAVAVAMAKAGFTSFATYFKHKAGVPFGDRDRRRFGEGDAPPPKGLAPDLRPSSV